MNDQEELERIIRDCLKDDYSKFCEIPSIKEMFSKIISAILSADYVKLSDVELDGYKLAKLLNDQNIIYENTDDNGEWIGECLDSAIAQAKPFKVKG